MRLKLAAAFAALLALATPTTANDSTAEMRAGGLVLTTETNIDMRSEDLFVSAAQVRVRYVFHNTAARDRTVTVAFPLPDRELADEQYGNTAFPSDFTTLVDGRRVPMEVERRAVLGQTDHTALLTRLGVPIAPGPDPEVDQIVRAMDALPRAEQDRLVRMQLAAVEEYDAGRGMERHLAPQWKLTEIWFWRQTFPARRDLVVQHSYTPGAGGSVGSLLAIQGMRNDPETRQLIRDYCVDGDFLRGVDRMMRQAGPDQVLPEQRVGYILTTGGNWRSPIGRFRLVVDKGRPDNLVSFCGTGVRRISPTQFEMTRTNWRPDRDLRVLIVQPAPRSVG